MGDYKVPRPGPPVLGVNNKVWHAPYFILKAFGEAFVLISSAYAQAAAPAGSPDPLMSFLPLILMFVVLYFLMIRPQMKRAKEHKLLVEGLQKGDEIVAASGIVGKVVDVDNSYITLEIANEDKPVNVIMQRQAVQTLLPKGTIKTLN